MSSDSEQRPGPKASGPRNWDEPTLTASSPANTELVAQAWAEIELSDISGKNWVRRGRGPGHFANAKAILAGVQNVAPTPTPTPVPAGSRVASFESGSFGEFDSINSSAVQGQLAIDMSRGYEGSHSAHATTPGNAQATKFARGIWQVPWTAGSDVWYGSGFYLPAGFYAAMGGEVAILRWDNYTDATGTQEQSGVVVQADGRLALRRVSYVDRSWTALIVDTNVKLTEGAFHWVEVRQKLSTTEGYAANELWVDGARVGSSAAANLLGDRRPLQLRVGIVATNDPAQSKPLELWFDRATISARMVGPVPTPTPTPTPTPSSNPVPPPASGAFFVAAIEGRDTYNHYYPGQHPGGGVWDNPPWDMASWTKFESNAGKRIWGLMTGDGEAWNGGYGDIDFIVQSNKQQGTVPVIDSDPSKMATLADISAGKFDSNLVAYAQRLKGYGVPIVLRPWCEMNGAWYRYAQEAHPNPAVFVSAWRHLVSLMRPICPNVAWHFCPNVDPFKDPRYTKIADMWPGSAYVDWTGLTGYSWAMNELLPDIFQSTYDLVVALDPSKPMMIGEVSSADHASGCTSPHKVAFIQQFFNLVETRWTNIKAVGWFNWYIHEPKNGVEWWDWPIESSPEGLAAFRTAISSAKIIGR